MYNINDFQNVINSEVRDPDTFDVSVLHKAISVAIQSPRDFREVKELLKEQIAPENRDVIVKAIGDYMAMLSIVAKHHGFTLSECCSKTMHSFQHRAPFSGMSQQTIDAATVAGMKKYKGD